MNCVNHSRTKATHKLDRGHRGKPVPLCQKCSDSLTQADPGVAAELITEV